MKYLFLLLFVPCIGKAQSKDSVTVMVPHFNNKGIQEFKPKAHRIDYSVLIEGTQAVFKYKSIRYEVSASNNRLMIVGVKGNKRDTLLLPVRK